LGLGRAMPCKSFFSTFWFLAGMLLAVFSFTCAPVYNFSPSGKLLVVLHAVNKQPIKMENKAYLNVLIIAANFY
jgi:hypothetical protein